MVHTIFVLRMPFNSRVIMSKSTKVLRSVYVSCVTAGGLMAGGSYSGAHSFTRRSFSIVMVAASIDMRFLRAMSRSPRGRVSDSEGSAKTPPLCEAREWREVTRGDFVKRELRYRQTWVINVSAMQ